MWTTSSATVPLLHIGDHCRRGALVGAGPPAAGAAAVIGVAGVMVGSAVLPVYGAAATTMVSAAEAGAGEVQVSTAAASRVDHLWQPWRPSFSNGGAAVVASAKLRPGARRAGYDFGR